MYPDFTKAKLFFSYLIVGIAVILNFYFFSDYYSDGFFYIGKVYWIALLAFLLSPLLISFIVWKIANLISKETTNDIFRKSLIYCNLSFSLLWVIVSIFFIGYTE